MVPVGILLASLPVGMDVANASSVPIVRVVLVGILLATARIVPRARMVRIELAQKETIVSVCFSLAVTRRCLPLTLPVPPLG